LPFGGGIGCVPAAVVFGVFLLALVFVCLRCAVCL
jgi:hypothetical protein